MAIWVPYYGSSTMEDLIKSQIDEDKTFPFENILLRNDYNYDALGNIRLYGKDRLQRLGGQKGGAIKLEAAHNWKITLKLTTTKGGYFEDNIDLGGAEVTGGQWGRSYAEFTLDGRNEDYLSLDLNSDHSGIAVFALRVNGYKISVDNPPQFGGHDVYIHLVKVEHYEEESDVAGPVSSEELQEEAIQDIQEDNETGGSDADPPAPEDEPRIIPPPTAPDWVILVGVLLGIGLVVGVVRR